MSGKEYERTLKLTNFALLCSGIKMRQNNLNKVFAYFINHYLFYYNFILLYTVIYGETIWIIEGIQTSKPFVELSLTCPCITISILGTIKSMCLYLNKGILVEVVNKLKEIHPTIDDTEEFERDGGIKSEIITESMKLLKVVFILLANILIIVITTFCFIPVLLSIYEYYKTGEFVVRYPFSVKYFFDVYNSEWWTLIYFHQVWATVIVTLNIFGCDTLFYALCVYINMHFRLLGLQLENIVSSKDETKTNLAKAVVRHQELIDLVNQTETLYSKSSLYNIVSSSILICLSAFNITVAQEMSTILAFISFLAMSLSQISQMCYFADLLMRSSMEISGSVYKCHWYEADEESKKTILFIMMRSQKACRLTAWSFVDLNLRAFTTILSRSWSYFALLKTVYK